jgi:uncharacterized protein with HEPN domain
MPSRVARPLLEDMLAYAKEAMDLVGARSGQELAADRMRFLAASRAVEIIGEAAMQVPGTVRDALPTIPFRQASDMRNRLIHGYGAVSPDILADTVRGDLPGLVAALENALARPLPDESA